MKNSEIFGFHYGFLRCSSCDFQFFFATFDFFICGYVNGVVYVPPLPENLEELMQTITTALLTVTQDMLQHVLEELEYRVDMCHVSGEVHIGHLLNWL